MSLTASGIAVYAITWVLTHFGASAVDSNAILSFVSVGGQLLGAIMTIWGQARRQDITGFFWHK